MSEIPSPGQIYRHFTGNLYRVVTLAQHSETGESLVVYQALFEDYKIFAKPLSLFMEKLDKEKYPQSASEFCFELQNELITATPADISAKDTTSEKTVSDGGTAKLDEKGIKEQTAENLFPEEEEQAEKDRDVCGGEPENGEEELNIDPLVLDFLDARTYEERLNILSALHHRITDDMINIMAIAAGVEIDEGDTEERFAQLRTCLKTFERYESSRLR